MVRELAKMLTTSEQVMKYNYTQEIARKMTLCFKIEEILICMPRAQGVLQGQLGMGVRTAY